jgi:hypothetical protein
MPISAEDVGVFAMHANHRRTIGRVNERDAVKDAD